MLPVDQNPLTMATIPALRFATNVGPSDRAIRVVAGVFLLGLAVFFLNGGWALLAGVVGLVLLATGALRFCPVYRLLGTSTLR
jgi:hypothetical protein